MEKVLLRIREAKFESTQRQASKRLMYIIIIHFRNQRVSLKVHKHEIFFDFFCRNRNLMVPGACNTRFLKIVFDSAEIWFLNISAHAQCAIKFVPRMLSMDCTCKNVHILPLAEHARKFVPRLLSMRWNRFRVCWECDKIVSAYAQHTHAIIFENDSKIPN